MNTCPTTWNPGIYDILILVYNYCIFFKIVYNPTNNMILFRSSKSVRTLWSSKGLTNKLRKFLETAVGLFLFTEVLWGLLFLDYCELSSHQLEFKFFACIYEITVLYLFICLCMSCVRAFVMTNILRTFRYVSALLRSVIDFGSCLF